MLLKRGEFMWTDALRLELIRDVERRPDIWSTGIDNFNNMVDSVAREIARNLRTVATGVDTPKTEFVKSEWKAISDECIRVLGSGKRIAEGDASIWRFSNVLRFMVYAVTHTYEGNASVLIFLVELCAFHIVSDADIEGVLWPYSKVKVRLGEKVKKAVIIAVGERHVINAEYMRVALEKSPYIVPEGEPTEMQMLPNHALHRTVPISESRGSLLRQNDGIVFHMSVQPEKDTPKKAECPPRVVYTPFSIPFCSTLRLGTEELVLPGPKTVYEVLSPSSPRSRPELDGDRDLFRRPIGPVVGYRGYNRRFRALAAFAEKHLANDPTFPVEVFGTTKRRRTMQFSISDCRRLLTSLDTILHEVVQMKRMVYDVKMNVDKELHRISLLFMNPQVTGGLAAPPTTVAAQESRLAEVQTDDVGFETEDDFADGEKVYDDAIYKYCSKSAVDHLAAACSHPATFVRRLSQCIFSRQQISLLFTDTVNVDNRKRVQWLKEITFMYYPHEDAFRTWQICMQALSGMAEYQNLLLKLENGWKQIPSSIRKEGRTPKRVRMDVASSSESEQENIVQKRDYLLPQTLFRLARASGQADIFAVKVAAILFAGDDDISRQCEEKHDQSRLNWLKAKVLELYPKDTETGANIQWNQCVSSLNSEAKRIKDALDAEYGA